MSKIMSDLNLLSALFNAIRVNLQSRQNKIDKNIYGASTKYDNAIKTAQSSAVKIEIPFAILKAFSVLKCFKVPAHIYRKKTRLSAIPGHIGIKPD